MTDNTYSVEQLAESLQVSEGAVYRWIRNGNIDAEKVDNKYVILFSGKNTSFFVQYIKDKYSRPSMAWVPDGITDYHEWHELIDEFVWLIKVCYGKKEEIKRKQFRADNILRNYLRVNKVSLKGVKNTFGPISASSTTLVSDDMKRAWYNEFAFSVPQKPSTLGHSFSDIDLNMSSSVTRFAFPSWRITTAYYSVYFYLRAVTLIKQQGFRLEQHGATIAAFKHGTSNSLARSLWRFPFDICYRPKIKVFRKELLPSKLEHTLFEYSKHPRTPHRSPLDIFERIYKVFKTRGKAGSRPSPYMLFDYLHDFRVWANYLDIDNLLSLSGGGYKAFLDNNLSFILFFIGAIAEICYMAVVGTKEYVQQLQNLYDLFASNNPELRPAFINTPLYQRHELYQAIELITESIQLQEPDDINRVNI